MGEGEDEQKEEAWERRGKEGARQQWKEGKKGRREERGMKVKKVLKRARCKPEEDRRREGRRVSCTCSL